MAAYAADYRDAKLLVFVLWFLLGISLVPVIASVHIATQESHRLLSVTALAFAIMYAVIVTVNYTLQFTFVRQSVLRGDLTGLDTWTAGNPNSAIFATDILGYLFQGLATLFLAPLFRGGRLLMAIKWLFVANGAQGIAGILAITFVSVGSAEGQALGVASLMVWGTLLSIALFLLAIAFRRRLLPGRTDAPRKAANI